MKACLLKVVAVAVLPLAAIVLPPPATAATPSVRVAIAFLPGPPPKVKPAMIDRLAAAGPLSLGFMSSIMGSYASEQTLLDISAGSRTWTSLYDGELQSPMALSVKGGEGRIGGWDAARRRARTPPADIVPGTLAQSVLDAGGSVSYVGIRGSVNREAIVASDRDGRVQRASLAAASRVGDAAARAWRRASLLVVRLPSGSAGTRGVRRLVAARRPPDVLLVVQQPSLIPRRLLAIGASGLGSGRDVRSQSTRTDGLVVSTDLAPTVLHRLGVGVPADVSGEPIETGGDRTTAQLSELRDRLAEVGPRRWWVVLLGLLGGIAVAAALGAAAGDARSRAQRTALLVALWLPTVLLATGAAAPGRLVEIALISAGCGLLALATELALPWPRSIAAPAAVAIGSEILDLAFGSPLTQRSLLGPNPILGARFYGVGNELEVTLAVIGLLGTGALLATAAPRRLRTGFVASGVALAFALSWGRLGADVGAALMIAAGTAAAAVATLAGGSLRRRAELVLAALAVLDLTTGGDSHFTRSVLRAGGMHDLANVAQRRLELSYNSLGRGVIGVLVAVAVAAIVLGVRARERLLGRLVGFPGLRAAMAGALVAVVVGAISNDSGPIILLIGTVYLTLAVGYLRAAPN